LKPPIKYSKSPPSPSFPKVQKSSYSSHNISITSNNFIIIS
jgi:hypothetical protein